MKLYKSWIIKNIFAPWYQQLVLGLFKINYEKNLVKGRNYPIYYNEEKKEEKDNNDITGDGNDNKIEEIDDKLFKCCIENIQKRSR